MFCFILCLLFLRIDILKINSFLYEVTGLDTIEKMEERKQLILDLMSHKDYRPMKIKELSMLLQVPNHERAALEEILNQLIQEGKIIRTKKGKYSLPKL